MVSWIFCRFKWTAEFILKLCFQVSISDNKMFNKITLLFILTFIVSIDGWNHIETVPSSIHYRNKGTHPTRFQKSWHKMLNRITLLLYLTSSKNSHLRWNFTFLTFIQRQVNLYDNLVHLLPVEIGMYAIIA
jgi:hypothetical protein